MLYDGRPHPQCRKRNSAHPPSACASRPGRPRGLAWGCQARRRRPCLGRLAMAATAGRRTRWRSGTARSRKTSSCSRSCPPAAPRRGRTSAAPCWTATTGGARLKRALPACQPSSARSWLACAPRRASPTTRTPMRPRRTGTRRCAHNSLWFRRVVTLASATRARSCASHRALFAYATAAAQWQGAVAPRRDHSDVAKRRRLPLGQEPWLLGLSRRRRAFAAQAPRTQQHGRQFIKHQQLARPPRFPANLTRAPRSAARALPAARDCDQCSVHQAGQRDQKRRARRHHCLVPSAEARRGRCAATALRWLASAAKGKRSSSRMRAAPTRPQAASASRWHGWGTRAPSWRDIQTAPRRWCRR